MSSTKALAIGKTPIVANDSRGFFTSRAGGTFVNEALAMLGEGVEPASIEHAGSPADYPAPPLQLSDEFNVALMHKIAAATRKDVEEQRRTSSSQVGGLGVGVDSTTTPPGRDRARP